MKNEETVTMPMDRYNHLVELEKEVAEIRSEKRAHTIYIEKPDMGACYQYLVGINRKVYTDDKAIAEIAKQYGETLEKYKTVVRELADVRHMSILEFRRWRKEKPSIRITLP
jgi:hypothetical protein